MKKLIALIMIIVLAVPAAAFSDTNLSEDLVGCWGVFCDWDEPGSRATTQILVLNNDGSMASISILSSKKEDGSLDVRVLRGIWEVHDTTITIANGQGGVKILEYADGCVWYLWDDLKLGLKKLPDMEKSQLVMNKKEGSNP